MQKHRQIVFVTGLKLRCMLEEERRSGRVSSFEPNLPTNETNDRRVDMRSPPGANRSRARSPVSLFSGLQSFDEFREGLRVRRPPGCDKFVQ